MFIDGQWVTDGSTERLPHKSPITGDVQAFIELAGEAEIDAAVAAAKSAFPAWQRLPIDERRGLLLRIEELIRRDSLELGRRSILEVGMTTSGARHYPALTAGWFGYYAGWADKIEGATIPLTPSTGFDFTLREPFGVVGVILTWNGALASIGMKVAPALAAGNCVVIKSPELAPFTAERFAQLAMDAGIPHGVINVVCGGPVAGERLIRHRDVAKVTFTGGTATARKVVQASAQNLTPLALELGGKSANLVFEDADLSRAVPEAVRNGIVVNSGQGCAFPTRLLVQRTVYDEVIAGLVHTAERVQIGDPMNATTEMGPVVCAASCERILDSIEMARSQGNSILSGGTRLAGELARGFFIPPTIVADVGQDDTLFNTEVFGPVLSVTAFDTEDEAVVLANCTDLGLAAYIQSRDVNRVHRLIPRLEAGTVHVNGKSAIPPQAPFGGYKQSGYGREGGRAGLEEFLQTKNVFIQG